MGSKGSSASMPEIPDPYEVANAQTDSNVTTALLQQGMNTTDQINPWGSVTYAQTGENFTPSSSGSRYYYNPETGEYSSTKQSGWQSVTGYLTPQYTQTTTLSDAQQGIFDSTQEAQANLSGYAANQSSYLANLLSGGIDTSGAPSLISNPGLATSLTGYNTDFSTDSGLSTALGDGYVTSYSGADDFSADRDAYTQALWARGADDRSATEAALRTTLANKGIREGSAAWNAEMQRLSRQVTDDKYAAYLAGGEEQARMVNLAREAATFGNESILNQFNAENSAALSNANFGSSQQQAANSAILAQQQFANDATLSNANFQNDARQQSVDETYAARTQLLNELMSALSGSQITNPATASSSTATTDVAGTDIASLVSDAYDAQMGQYAASQAQSQAAMGGLFGLGSSFITALPKLAALSDIRLKKDIERIGSTTGGTPLYAYRYIWGGPVKIGVMAQEVPDAAILMPNGYFAVDYSKVA